MWGQLISAGLSYLGARQSRRASQAAAGREDEYRGQQAEIAKEQWQRFKEIFAPLEDEIVRQSMDPGEYERLKGQATTDVRAAYGRAEGARRRELGRYGLRPDSGRFAGLERETAVNQVRDEVSARNLADDRMWAKKIAAASLGRGLPAQAMGGFQSVAGAYGNRAIAAGQNASRGYQAAGYWLGKAVDGWGPGDSGTSDAVRTGASYGGQFGAI